MATKSFFSIPFSFIRIDREQCFDLYVNSSTVRSKEHFVRIFPRNEFITVDDIAKLKKYTQLYVPETQRADYLRSLIALDDVKDEEKVTFIKDSAITYLDKIFDVQAEFTTEFLGEALSGCRDSVESMVEVIQEYDVEHVQRLIGNLSFHDFYTYDHSINVSMYCISLFQALHPNAHKNDVITCGLGGLLHDLGKIKIPTTIINNPGKLSDEDFVQIKSHPQYGLELLMEEQKVYSGLDIKAIARVIHEHHENYNGTGYPRGLKEEEIHEMARITAIADFFDAITTKRSYHEALSTQDAINVMAKTKGRKIDPKIFEKFLRSIKQMEKSGSMVKELPDDFDPCQPQNELPFTEVVQQKAEADFGKIRLVDKKKKNNAA